MNDKKIDEKVCPLMSWNYHPNDPCVVKWDGRVYCYQDGCALWNSHHKKCALLVSSYSSD